MSDGWTYAPFQMGFLGAGFAGMRWFSPVLAQPPNFGVDAGTTVTFVAGTTGIGLNGQFYGDLTEGSTSITNCTEIDTVCPGQILRSAFIPFGTVGQFPPILPCSRIISLADGTIDFGNGEFDQDTNAYLDSQGALGDQSNWLVTTAEDWPQGTLAAIVSPSTGVTIVDYNADGTGSVSYRGDGSIMANLTGQAEAMFAVTFADTGTFTVQVEYTATAGSNFAPGGPLQPAANNTPLLTITVS